MHPARHADDAQRRLMVIWPVVNAPEHEFVPLYVLVMIIVVRLTCAVPVAFDEQPDDIMLPGAMSIVKVMSSPDIVPWKSFVCCAMPGSPAEAPSFATPHRASSAPATSAPSASST